MENEFPSELKQMISSVDGDPRQIILSLLMRKKVATYTTIKNSVKIVPGRLNYHLNKLVSAGLIERRLHIINNKKQANYLISELGKHFITSLFQPLIEKRPYFNSITPSNDFGKVLDVKNQTNLSSLMIFEKPRYSAVSNQSSLEYDHGWQTGTAKQRKANMFD